MGRSTDDNRVVRCKLACFSRHVLRLVSEHPQIDPDRFRTRALIVDLDRHDVCVRRCDEARTDTATAKRHERVIQRKMLMKILSGKKIFARLHEVDVDEPAPIAVVRISSRKAEGWAARRVKPEAFVL